MDIKKKIERHERHIEALEISYEKMIQILQKPMDKQEDEDGNETVSLKDNQIKIFSEGQLRTAETANSLLAQISEKEDELEKIKNPNKKRVQKEENTSHLNSRLK